MATTRITEKLSKLIASQLPEFVQSDYGTFTAFLQYYYEYLEQDQEAQEIIQNARSYADVDRTASSFVEYFLKQYGHRIPTNLLVNKPFLIKNLRSVYEAKGSELSFKILFRILFDTSVNITYPYENVLRASDGIWQQLVSIRIETQSGDRNKINEHFLKYLKGGVLYTIQVVKVVRLTSTLTEVFLDPTSPAITDSLFEDGDVVYTEENNTTVYTGTVKLTTTGYTIATGGSGFKVGQIFKVNYAGAVNTLFKVTKVDGDGGIEEIKIINYGYNFTETVTLDFSASSPVGSASDEYNTTTEGFSEAGVVYTSGDYFLDPTYADPTYVMTAQVTFSSSQVEAGGTIVGNIDETYATINFTVGTIGRYPGTFVSNRGFISDNEIRLEDDQLYQPFAYLTNTDIDISKFYDIVKSTVHPAGQNLFNNRVLEADINVYANVSVISQSNIFEELLDVIQIIDQPSLTIYRSAADTQSFSDSANLLVGLSINNTANVTDSITSGVLFTQDYADPTYFAGVYVSSSPPSGTVVI